VAPFLANSPCIWLRRSRELRESSFLTLKISAKFDRGHPVWVAKCRWGGLKSTTFDKYLAISRKQDDIDAWFLLKSNNKSYTLYGMVTLPITLSDPYTAPNHPILYILHHLSYVPNKCSWKLQIWYTYSLNVASHSPSWQVILERGVVRVTWPISSFWCICLIFGANEAKHFKFRLQIERKEDCHYICWNSAIWGSRDLLNFFGKTAIILETLR